MHANGFGRLLPGFAADMVVVKGDPFTSLPENPEIVAVVSNGKLHQQAELFKAVENYADTIWSEPIGAAFRYRSA